MACAVWTAAVAAPGRRQTRQTFHRTGAPKPAAAGRGTSARADDSGKGGGGGGKGVGGGGKGGGKGGGQGGGGAWVPTGATLLKRLQLRALGWRVLPIPLNE